MPVISAPAQSLRAAPVLRPRLVNAAASPVTASAGDLLVVDASGGNVVINPPANPAGGDTVEIIRTDSAVNLVRWTGTVHGDTEGAQLVGLYTGTRLTWTGSVWVVSATNAGAPSPAGIGAMAVETNTAMNAYGSTGQSIPNVTNTVVAFENVQRTSPLVTVATQGAGHQFTLNRAGIWVGYATVRALTSSGEFYATFSESSGVLHGSQGNAPSGSQGTRSLPLSAWLPAGTVLTVMAYQNSGGTVALATGWWCQIRLAWVHD